MILAVLLLATGLIISAVAIYYSVIGLAAIFAAATIPIYIMGGSLEVAKLVCASWLKANWDRAPRFMKYYMITAVAVLMLITSMGIFGFLSKAHTDQGIVSGDAQAKLALYDEKIKISKENIDANRKALKQLDEAVDQVMVRSQDEKGADKAVALRRGQAKERTRLLQDIEAEQKRIAQFNEERAPIAAENRKIEAEVGPIKYIAKLIYGDNPDANILEKAVTWVIILIVVVFDPLAVIMLLAAQMTFSWLREQRAQEDYPTIADLDRDVGEPPTKEEKEDLESGWPFPTYEEITPNDDAEVKAFFERGKEVARALDAGEPIPEKYASDVTVEESILDKHPYLNKPFKNFENLTPMVHKPEIPVVEEPVDDAVAQALAWAEEQKTAPVDVPVDFPKKKTKYIIKEQNQQVKKSKE